VSFPTIESFWLQSKIFNHKKSIYFVINRDITWEWGNNFIYFFGGVVLIGHKTEAESERKYLRLSTLHWVSFSPLPISEVWRELQHKRSGGQKPNSLKGKETNLEGGRKEEQRIFEVKKPVDLGQKHYHSPCSQRQQFTWIL